MNDTKYNKYKNKVKPGVRNNSNIFALYEVSNGTIVFTSATLPTTDISSCVISIV